MRELFRRLLHAVKRDRFEADLAEELEFHRAMKQRDFEDAGMDAGEAAYAARRALGNVELAQERARDVWIAPWFRDAWQDIRFAVRSLIKDRALHDGIHPDARARDRRDHGHLLDGLRGAAAAAPVSRPGTARRSPEEEPPARLAE